MFTELILLGPTEESIIVQTKKHRNLANFIAPEPEFQHIQAYRLLLRKFGRHWSERKPPTGGYNCTGLVWASRRTVLPEESQWWAILDDDGYRRLAGHEPPCPDDVAIYVEEPANTIIHVARVVEVRKGVADDSPGIPWVLSKWDLKSGEVVHSVYDVPYREHGFQFRIEYWTDRPDETGGKRE